MATRLEDGLAILFVIMATTLAMATATVVAITVLCAGRCRRMSTHPSRYRLHPPPSARFLADHPNLAADLRAKEAKRRERKASKAGEDDQSDLFDDGSDEEDAE